ncbi:hypothetical protein LCM10_04820 [Rossellomorea aquimaris]|uniref:hypothetical protein n=1 Tax=Rossellomorea aquimaris TaxID=189382 RepID=UPI001CD516B3|nr:hypothetical protein [Rossellomorea aquimaris]MCA1054302.1 hypothetical protein [Rossellomorea aquimaris]
MKINPSYPYPVLYMNNDDYIGTNFHVKMGIRDSFGQVQITAEFILDNEPIRKMIEDGTCVYLIHVECPQTSFRKAYKGMNDKLEITVPSNQLRGKITIHSFIIANKNIDHYTNEFLNDWYQEVPISFEKGNFIAIGEAIETTLFEDDTELLNLPSIVTVTKSLKNDYMDVDLHSNNITIQLPEKEYKLYASSAHSTLKSTILSTVIVPSLVYVFSKVREKSGDLEEYTWYQVLEKIFAENDYNLEDVGSDKLSPLKAAQIILRNPLKTSFEEIERLNRMED